MQVVRIPKYQEWTDPPLSKNEQLEPRSNIWPIALVIHLLMTMIEIEDFVRPTDHIREEDFIRFGKHFMGPIQTGQNPDYSERIRDLVRDCLNPKIESRPTASSLVTRTRARLEPYLIATTWYWKCSPSRTNSAKGPSPAWSR
jgi:hypothetical protein